MTGFFYHLVSISLTIEAGWQTESYIRAIERIDGFNKLNVFNNTATSNQRTKVSNFGDEGLFIGVKVNTGVF